jgi:hypothetical protein
MVVPTHRFLSYKPENPQVSEVNRIATSLLNMMFNLNMSTSKYRKYPNLSISWSHPKMGMQSGTLRYSDVVNHIAATRSLNHELLSIPNPGWNWLDNSNLILATDMSPMQDETGTLTFNLETNLGEGFPFKPNIDREGIACASFQMPMQKNIVKLHKALVNDSNTFLEYDSDWLTNLRTLISDSVTLVDMTLHQLYYAAKYGASPTLTFDYEKLGSPNGRRIADKLKWIYPITGKPLDDVAEEIAAFNKIKKVRNHLTHFDPPCFALTIDDVVTLLNMFPLYGRFLWKIRNKIGVNITSDIISILLLPTVVVVPKHKDLPRHKQGDNVGYSSCDATRIPGWGDS